MWLEIKTDLMWVVVGVEGENRNKLGACQQLQLYSTSSAEALVNCMFGPVRPVRPSDLYERM